MNPLLAGAVSDATAAAADSELKENSSSSKLNSFFSTNMPKANNMLTAEQREQAEQIARDAMKHGNEATREGWQQAKIAAT